MEYVSTIFSIAFFLGALVSISMGVYILRLNSKFWINRIYFLISLSLAVWSLSFAMANCATDFNSVLFWRRVSALGWGTIFSFTLHFLLLMSNNDKGVKSSKLMPLLYLPSVVLIYAFSLSNRLTAINYNIVEIEFGWTNIAVNNSWDMFYYAYYVIYIGLSLMVVFSWRKKLQDRLKIIQTELIFAAIFGVVFFGSLTDLIANNLLPNPIPQVAPLFSLIALWAMYYAARYHGVLSKVPEFKADIIVTEQDRKQLFIYVSRASILAGIATFLADYLPAMGGANDLTVAIHRSATLLTLGISIKLIQLIKNEIVKEKLTIGVLVLVIPIFTLQYVDNASVSVWAFPMVIIISSFLFSKRTLLVTTTAIAIFTQVIMMVIYPETTVVVSQYNYLGRIGIFFFVFLTGLYINKVYVGKIQENDRQIKFQEIISDITFDFISFNEENSNEKIDGLLERIGHFFNVDRVYLFTINNNLHTLTYANEWCNKGITAEIDRIQELSLSSFPWWIKEHKKREIVYIEDVSQMPSEASVEQKLLNLQKVKSVLSVPVISRGVLHGFIGMDSVVETKRWNDENVKLLEIMANILSSVLAPVKTTAETRFMAYNDSLTKLPNRFLFDERVSQAINLYANNDNQLAVIFLDLDKFKAVNDTIGHRGGDIILKNVSEKLVSVVKETDLVARFGGDEFMIMLNSAKDYQDITDTANKIMNIFSDTFTVNKQSFIISASAGIAIYPQDGKNAEELIKNADMAMYSAKLSGGNYYEVSSQKIKDDFAINLDLTNYLSHALENDEFIIHYQPQVDAITSEIVGVEALLRWMHPTRGLIAPNVFIPIAESNNLINGIGEWVLESACAQNKAWQDLGLKPIKVAVNLSAKQILNPNLVSDIKNILKDTNLDAKYLELEITESIAIKDTLYVLDVLGEISDLGVTIAIDDFGMEYSSLSRLKQMPVDMLKIDMEFIKGIETSLNDRAIVSVIINLAKSLNLKVLAEGVETQDQLEFLRYYKCDYIQGFYYYQPMDGSDIEKILSKNNI